MNASAGKYDEYVPSLWEGESYFAASFINRRDALEHHFVEFDFNKMAISTNGFLAEVLESIPSPIFLPHAYLVRQIVRETSTNPAIAQILSTPSAELDDEDIRAIWRGAEHALLHNTKRCARQRRSALLTVISTVESSDLTLRGGKSLYEIRFDSIFRKKHEVLSQAGASQQAVNARTSSQDVPNAAKDLESEDVSPQKSFWQGQKFFVYASDNCNGTIRQFHRELDFEKLGISKNGFLAQLMEKFNTPVHSTQIISFLQLVTALSHDADMVNMLSTPPEQLHERDIVKFWLSAERVIHNHTKRENPRSFFWSCRGLVDSTSLAIGDGQTVDNINFETTLPTSSKEKKSLISDNFEPNIQDPVLAEPVTTPLASETNISDRILAHLNGRIDFIVNAFSAYIAKCLSLAKLIEEKKGEGFPSFLSKFQSRAIKNSRILGDSLKNLTPEKRFHVACYRIAAQSDSVPYSKVEVKVDDFIPIASLNLTRAGRSYVWMYSDCFLTSEALLAICVILMLETVWNNGTVLSLDNSRVIKTQFGYLLSGSKSKTKDIMQEHEIKTSREYDDLSDQERLTKYPARFCVELLLRNLQSINTLTGLQETRLFLSLQATDNDSSFAVIPVNKNLRRLCERVGVEPFTLKQLRDQGASRVYFRDGKNIHHLMVLLGHKTIEATAGYLYNGIVELECEANNNRFTQVVEQSILFVSGRELDHTLDETVLAQARRLFFPISDFADEAETCLIGMWLKSHATMKLVIDEDCVALISLQKIYYAKHAVELASRDPDRFRDSHLPLIIVCTALHRIISTSRFRLLLKDCDTRYQKSHH
jgi:hypothetical protein